VEGRDVGLGGEAEVEGGAHWMMIRRVRKRFNTEGTEVRAQRTQRRPRPYKRPPQDNRPYNTFEDRLYSSEAAT
jgi:hypothetical protein